MYDYSLIPECQGVYSVIETLTGETVGMFDNYDDAAVMAEDCNEDFAPSTFKVTRQDKVQS